jgi:hypothetical protein
MVFTHLLERVGKWDFYVVFETRKSVLIPTIQQEKSMNVKSANYKPAILTESDSLHLICLGESSGKNFRK